MLDPKYLSIVSGVKSPTPTSFAAIAPVKKLSKVPKFGKEKPVEIEYQTYTAELKRRMVSDNSELLLGTATIKVPKTLHDLSGKTPVRREVWDAFACTTAYCLICSEAGAVKGLNQLFLFDNQWNLITRLETNAWDEGEEKPCQNVGVSDRQAEIAWKAFNRCEVKVDWLETPIVA